MNPNFTFPEKLLHFIWQFQRFDPSNLETDSGEKLQIIQIGQLNTNAGPDFQEAKIKIGEMVWAGNVEIHIDSKDWELHNHHQNLDFDNIILHVVWENGKDIRRKNGQSIPTLSLKNRVSNSLIFEYQALMNNTTSIPCYSQFKQINDFTKMLMLEKVLVNRLERKAEIVVETLKKCNGDWEETTYQLLGKTLGFGLNSIPFERLTQLVPLKILQKHSDHLLSIEALLFGTAGLIARPIDNYSQSLKKEFDFLQSKYNLPDSMAAHEWKFMRTRPANFPSIRIAQFAQMIQQTKSLFSYFLLFENIDSLKQMLKVKPSKYWESRVNFGKIKSEKQIGIGEATIENILINAIVPLLVAYSMFKNEPAYIEKAINLLEKLKPEKNKITRFWNQLDFIAKNAFDSQALIELHNEYCQKKACLSCSIGVALLK
ncbi:MAG: DUF2851 family protein [Bacteroidota bacterium]